MSPDKKIVAVVVTYNRLDQLKACIQAIRNQDGATCDVLVVNNGSTDGTAEFLSGCTDSGVRFVDTGENTGSAGGFYHGVKEAYEAGYSRIWVMDDDVVPDATALKRLADADEFLEGDWGFLSSFARWKDGTPCKANIQKTGVFSFVGDRDRHLGLVPVKIAAMASLYLNADAVKQIGYPIADYVIYSDDYEYTSRISEQFTCYMVPSSTVLHNTAVNMKVDFARDSPDRVWRYRYLYRNDVHLYRRYGAKGWAYLVAKAGFTTANVLLRSKGDRIGKLRTLYSSLAEGLRYEPVVEETSKGRSSQG
ncbi:glycosyltransferase family 2 protein [Parafannyhessea umbonata]|uniref:Glycosyltransferase, GT2 family n=1 Tax=Parafannyhessea umbonata TaxID=604330 RepID=A0A1H9NGX5_9ACTN|nr:glycosyltransferase family 2 protein [Parafannyhessea umbonata]SER35210.1 Glycosyltransferase, GT2 family [Parafannyhessea umbonata]